MDTPLRLQREVERWFPLMDHPVQQELIADNVRFKVVPAGRRSGKTERAKRYLAKTAMTSDSTGKKFFAAAPTYSQAKKIWWDDLKLLTFSSTHLRKPSESELIIYLPNEAEIHVIGLDVPARIEGQYWHGGIVDEIADVKPTAWPENILPALNTVSPLDPDYRAWCWLIGVPDGLNHYYDLYQYADRGIDNDWKAYTWKSSDILPNDVIESAKRSMSLKQFKQEFEASFETATNKIYSDYDKNNHTSSLLEPHEQLLWCHDFNYTPLSSCICVERNDKILILDEIILTSAVSEQSALEFINRYSNHENKNVIVYGDPAGRAGEKHGHRSDYTAIENVLKSNGWKCKRRVKPKAPGIKDRQNNVRAKIRDASGERHLFVNPDMCPYADKGLSTVQLKGGSSFQEKETDYQHITTAIGYYISYEHPINKNKMSTKNLSGF